jgi:hypothetical protein
MSDIEKPTLAELVDIKKDWGLEGEADTFLTVLLAKQGGGFLVFKGPSRSGKDYICQATNHVEKGSASVQLPESSSPKALFQMKDKLNEANVHLYPDMGTTIPEHLLMQIKRHGEGRSITHTFTDVEGGRDTQEQTIQPPDAFIMFVATDNEDLDLNDVPEVRNRALIVYTDASKSQNEQVLDRQAMEESTYRENTVSDERVDEVRQYLADIPNHRYNVADHMEDGIGEMMVPYSWEFRQQDPLPSHFPEVRMDYKRLMRFMKIMAIFNHQERMDPLSHGAPTLLATPIDGWLTMRVFGEKMIMSSLNLEELDLEIVQELRDTGMAFTVSDLHSEMRSRGYHASDRDIRTALKNMKTKGYVSVDQAQTPQEWHATAFADIAKPDNSFDWDKICRDAKERLLDDDTWDRSIIERYSAEFLEGPQEAVMPFGEQKGETINIREWSGFSDELEDVMGDVDEVNDNGLYDGDDGVDDEEDAAEPMTNGRSNGLGDFS